MGHMMTHPQADERERTVLPNAKDDKTVSDVSSFFSLL